MNDVEFLYGISERVRRLNLKRKYEKWNSRKFEFRINRDTYAYFRNDLYSYGLLRFLAIDHCYTRDLGQSASPTGKRSGYRLMSNATRTVPNWFRRKVMHIHETDANGICYYEMLPEQEIISAARLPRSLRSTIERLRSKKTEALEDYGFSFDDLQILFEFCPRYKEDSKWYRLTFHRFLQTSQIIRIGMAMQLHDTLLLRGS